MLKKLQKVRVFALAVAPAFTCLVAQAKRMKRQHETAGSDPQALLRLQKKVVISRARLPPLAHFAEISLPDRPIFRYGFIVRERLEETSQGGNRQKVSRLDTNWYS